MQPKLYFSKSVSMYVYKYTYMLYMHIYYTHIYYIYVVYIESYVLHIHMCHVTSQKEMKTSKLQIWFLLQKHGRVHRKASSLCSKCS